MERRDFLIGGLGLATAAAAYAATPRERMSLMGKLKLEAIPKSFAGWTHRESGQIVTPESDNSLSAKLYSQSVGRIYVREDGSFAMMLIAYGNTQSDTLQLHRPEVCYPAFGFEVQDTREATFPLASGGAVPGRNLIAATADRTEYVSYWTRIGNELPASGSEQRSAKLRSQLQGIIPDGILARISTIHEDRDMAFATNTKFISDLLQAVTPPMRTALIGPMRGGIEGG